MNTETGEILSPEEVERLRDAARGYPANLTPITPWEKAELEGVPEAERPAALAEMRRGRAEELEEKKNARLGKYVGVLGQTAERLRGGVPVNRGRARAVERSVGRERAKPKPKKPKGARSRGVVQARYVVADEGKRAHLDVRVRDEEGRWFEAGRVEGLRVTAADRDPDGTLAHGAVAKLRAEALRNLRARLAPRGVELKPEPKEGEAWPQE